MKYLRPFNESNSLSISDIDTINDITLELSDLGLSVKSYYASKVFTGGWRQCDKHNPNLEHMFITIVNPSELSDSDEKYVTPGGAFEVNDQLIDVIDRLDNYVKSVGWKPLITFESYNGDFNLGEDSFKPSYLKTLKGLLLIELEFNLTKLD